MQDEMAQLLTDLRGAKDFEAAAAATLRRLQAVAQEAVASSRYAARGRVLRGIVHLRPGEAYRSLAALEVGAAEITDASVGTPFFTSATAWRAVVEHRCAVSIDVNVGTVQPHAPNAPVTGDPSLAGFNSHESRQRFLGRHATHVCVLPLRTPGGDIEGMISLEADCLAAMGQDFVWLEAGDRLQLLADVAAPYRPGCRSGPWPGRRWMSSSRWWGAPWRSCCPSSVSSRCRMRPSSSAAPRARASHGWRAGATSAPTAAASPSRRWTW
ncbi:hypothetical protein QEG98_31180 [Myxococcus sp. MxC21-1]|nr:hypothetical protein QEG98_31180 [Myxococcus sp. MxC21-1]